MVNMLQSFVVAEDQVALVVAKVHAIPLAVSEPLAFATLVLFHPRAVSVRFESVLPYINKVILIDISLVIVCSDASASRY